MQDNLTILFMWEVSLSFVPRKVENISFPYQCEQVGLLVESLCQRTVTSRERQFGQKAAPQEHAKPGERQNDQKLHAVLLSLFIKVVCSLS